MIRIAIADDLQMIRNGFELILENEPDMTVVASVADGKALLEAIKGRSVDIVLMDIRMPELDGLAATEQLLGGSGAGAAAGGDARASGADASGADASDPDESGADASATDRGTRPKVVILTTFGLDEYVSRAIVAGASGFLLKDAPADDLVAGIRAVARGDSVLAPSVVKTVMDQARTSISTSRVPGMAELTGRELDVLRQLAAGRSNAEIAEALHLSEATIKTHVTHVLAKLGVRDRVQAVIAAFASGLVSPDLDALPPDRGDRGDRRDRPS